MTNEPLTERHRQELLDRIWAAQARALATILETTEPKDLQAALLNTARQFLGDNGVSVETIGKTTSGHMEGLAAVLRSLGADELPTPEEEAHYQETHGAPLGPKGGGL